MKGLPASGHLIALLPITILLMTVDFVWAFVPFTAAGQQGILTPFRFFIP